MGTGSFLGVNSGRGVTITPHPLLVPWSRTSTAIPQCLCKGALYLSLVKVKWSFYRPGVAQRVGTGIALLFHDRGTRREWVASSTSRPHFTPGINQVPILQEAGWAPGPVWTGGNYLTLVVPVRWFDSVAVHINCTELAVVLRRRVTPCLAKVCILVKLFKPT